MIVTKFSRWKITRRGEVRRARVPGVIFFFRCVEFLLFYDCYAMFQRRNNKSNISVAIAKNIFPRVSVFRHLSMRAVSSLSYPLQYAFSQVFHVRALRSSSLVPPQYARVFCLEMHLLLVYNQLALWPELYTNDKV